MVIAAIGRRGQTILPPEPPPGGEGAYGPTAGRSAVIAAAAPRSVTAPPGAITFSSASDLQTKINANAANTNFVPSAGWSSWTTRVIPNGKFPKIWVPGTPGSRTFDAGGAGLFCMIGGGTDGHEMHGGTWRNVGNVSGGGHGIAAGPNSVIQDVIVEDHYNAGIRISGNNVEVGYFITRDNGADGLSNPGLGNGTLVHHGEFSGNGFRDPDAAPDHGGSGKWSGGVSNNIIEYCYAHEVWDYGWWHDGTGSLIVRESVAEDCRKNAPFFELMDGGGQISRCWLARNGDNFGGGTTDWFNANVTCIAVSPTITGQQILIQYNHIESAHILLAINNQTSRPNTKRVKVFDNRFKLTNSTVRLGGQDSQASGSRTMHLESPSNGGTFEFDRNLYQGVGFLPDNNFRFPTSATNDGTNMTWATWRGLGFDINSQREQVSS